LAASRFTQAKVSFGHGTVTALDERPALVLHTVYQPYNLAEAYLDTVLTMNERQAGYDIIDRRINERIPAAYLTNKLFCRLIVYVDRGYWYPDHPSPN